MSTMRQLLKQLVGVRIELDGVEYPNAYSDDLAIDRTDLDSEFTEHAERYAYYATLSEMAEDRHVRMKEELENLTAFIDHEKRDAAKSIQLNDPKFKMTEAMFEHEVKLDSRYQGKLKEVQDARHLAKVLKNAPMAFAHRRDMLIEIGKSHNAGMYDPRVTQGKAQQVRAIIQANRSAGNLPAPSYPPPDTNPPDLNGIPPDESPTVAPSSSGSRRRAPRNS